MQQQTQLKSPAAPTPKRDPKATTAGPDVAQHAAQQGYLRSLRGPGEGQAALPGAAPGAPAAAAGTPSTDLAKPEEGFWARTKRKAQGAAAWVGKKAGQARDATVKAYNYTADKAGAAWDKTKTVATDVYEAASKTSLGYKDGKVVGKTDAAEVHDLMPQRYRDALEFDKSAKNEVSLEYDVDTGLITARAANLALSKLAMGPLAAGPTTLSNVVITVQKSAGKGGKGADDVRATISVGGIAATKVAYMGPKGLLRADAVQLSGLEAEALNKGGGLPMTDEAKDHLAGSFMLEKAVVRGVSGDAMSAGEISTSRVGGRMDQDAGALSAQVGAAEVKDGRFGQRSVKHAAVQGAEVDVRGRGGALPLAEATEQPLKVDARLAGAQVEGLKTPEASVAGAQVRGVQTQYDMATKNGSARVAEADVRGVKAGGTSVRSAQLQGFHGARQGTALSGGVESAKVAGVRTRGAKVEDAHVDAATARYDTATGDGSAAARGVRATGVSAGKHGVRSVSATDLAASRAGDHVEGRVGTAEAKGLKAGGVSGDVSARGVSAEADLGARPTFAGRATQLQGRNLSGHGARATSATVDGARVSRDARGTLSGGADGARVEGLDVAGTHVDAARVAGVSASRTRQGTVDAGVASARAEGVSGDLVRAKSLSVDGARAHSDARGAGLTVDRAAGEGLGTRGVSATSAEVSQLAVGRTKSGTTTAQVDAARVRGLDVADRARVADLQADRLAVTQKGEHVAVTADAARGQGIAGKGFEARSASLTGLDAGFGGGRDGKARVAARQTELEAAKIGTVGLGKGSLTDAEVAVEKGGAVRTRAEALSVRDLKSGGFDARTIDGKGVATRHEGDRHGVKLGEASVTGARVDAGGVRGTLDEGHVSGADATFGGGDATGKVGRLGGRGLAFESVPTEANAPTNAPATNAPATATTARTSRTPASSTNTQSPAATTAPAAQTGLTQGALVRGLAPRVDAVDAKFTAPLRAGDQGAVDIEENTRMTAEVHARNNRLVPGDTGVRFSRDLDGPAWIGVRGVSLQEAEGRRGAPPEGKLEADLSGFWDQDITEQANKGLGRPDAKTVPLSISEMGRLAGDEMDRRQGGATSTASTPVSASTAARGRGTQNRTANVAPAQTQAAAKANPVDMSGHTLDARVALSAGKADLGHGQHVTIGQAGQGGNTVNVRSRGGEEMVVDMVQVVLGSLNLQVGQEKPKTVQAKGAQVQQAQVRVAEGARGSRFKGSIGAFETEGLSAK